MEVATKGGTAGLNPVPLEDGFFVTLRHQQNLEAWICRANRMLGRRDRPDTNDDDQR